MLYHVLVLALKFSRRDGIYTVKTQMETSVVSIEEVSYLRQSGHASQYMAFFSRNNIKLFGPFSHDTNCFGPYEGIIRLRISSMPRISSPLIWRIQTSAREYDTPHRTKASPQLDAASTPPPRCSRGSSRTYSILRTITSNEYAHENPVSFIISLLSPRY